MISEEKQPGTGKNHYLHYTTNFLPFVPAIACGRQFPTSSNGCHIPFGWGIMRGENCFPDFSFEEPNVNILPIFQAWLLMIFIQFTPFTGTENHQRVTFVPKDSPNIQCVIESTCVTGPASEKVLAATIWFTGPVETAGSLSAVIIGVDKKRTLANMEDAEGIDQVPPNTNEKMTLFPGKKARMAVFHNNRIARATCLSEKGTTTREVEFTHNDVRALITYDPAKGVQKVRFTIPGAGSDAEFVAMPSESGTSGQKTEKAPKPARAASHEIIKEYSGLISASLSLAPGGKMPMKAAEEEQLVIDNQEKYQQFVSRIYPDVVTMTNPAPKSEDPLLQMAPIDFPRERLIVFMAHDGMYGKIELKDITEKDGVLTLHGSYSKPTLNELGMSQPMGVGRYRAFLLKADAPKLELDIQKEP